MSTLERVLPLPANLLGRLARALEATAPAEALREELSRCAIPEHTRERLLGAALSLGQRARQRELRVSPVELELALGVLLVLTGLTANAEPEVRS